MTTPSGVPSHTRAGVSSRLGMSPYAKSTLSAPSTSETLLRPIHTNWVVQTSRRKSQQLQAIDAAILSQTNAADPSGLLSIPDNRRSSASAGRRHSMGTLSSGGILGGMINELGADGISAYDASLANAAAALHGLQGGGPGTGTSVGGGSRRASAAFPAGLAPTLRLPGQRGGTVVADGDCAPIDVADPRLTPALARELEDTGCVIRDSPHWPRSGHGVDGVVVLVRSPQREEEGERR